MATPTDTSRVPDGLLQTLPVSEFNAWTDVYLPIAGFALGGAFLIWLLQRALRGLLGKQSPWRDGR